MKRQSVAAVAVLAIAATLAACTTPATDKPTEQAQAKRTCEDAPTGSNMRRCGAGDRVGSISREEIERTGMPSSVGRDAYK